jgi:signal transduction histidine kinase
MKANPTIKFEHDYIGILIWFFFTYIIFDPVLNFLRTFTFETSSLIDEPLKFVLFNISTLSGFFLFTLIAYLVFYKFYPNKKFLLGVGVICALMIPICYRYFVEQKLYLWLFGVTNYRLETTFKFYFSDNTYFAVYYLPSGILYYFFQRNKALQQARIEAEKLKVEAELQHLRSQINPHFLFNSLNNIYALAYEKSDKILPALEGLSDVLRYALYENADMVPFKKEWKKVLQLISLENLRLEHPVDFKIDISPEVYQVNVPPLVLMPLIENVYKHGDLQAKESPCSINAFLEGNTLKFEVSNQIGTKPQKDATSGIGLKNIEKRLHHLYGEKARIRISENEAIFTIELSLPL